jgi:hypothetical protein
MTTGKIITDFGRRLFATFSDRLITDSLREVIDEDGLRERMDKFLDQKGIKQRISIKIEVDVELPDYIWDTDKFPWPF